MDDQLTDNANQDTVRSVAELIRTDQDDDDSVFEADRASDSIDVENELARRGFPTDVERHGSISSTITWASDKEETKPRFIWTRTLISEILLVCILACVIITATSVVYHFYNHQQYMVELGRRIYFDENTRRLDVNNISKETVLTGKLGLDIPPMHLPYDCSKESSRSSELCMLWRGEARLNITYRENGTDSCYDVEWESLDDRVKPHDCYMLSGGQWYGGPLHQDQTWPIENLEFEKRVMVPGSIHRQDTFGPVIERYWLSSLGVAIYVENDSPLFVSMNASDEYQQLCLYADFEKSPYKREDGGLPRLNYTICVDTHVKAVHQKTIRDFGKPPGSSPKSNLFHKPIWSTGARYGKQLNQASVTQFSEDIVANYKQSLFVFSNGWQSNQGDLTFDNARFPGPESMLNELRAKSFDVAMAIHPLMNTDSQSFQTAVKDRYLVKDSGGEAPGLCEWFDGPPVSERSQGIAATLDLHPPAKYWWKEQLETFKTRFGPVYFSMEGGEVDVLPFHAVYNGGFRNPSSYSQALADFASELGSPAFVHSAYRSQHLPVIVQLAERGSTWADLQSLIPTVLQVGVFGYPFILPDSIGGQSYTGSSIPSKELYIRWMQVVTFLPLMHFSISPSQYDADTQVIAKDLLELRDTVIGPLVATLAQNSSRSLDPIVQPMWWLDPSDADTFSIDDQFLLGPDYMVAPVVTSGVRSRSVYIPAGRWEEQSSKAVYEGPAWQADIASQLNAVLYFKRMQ